MIRPRLVAVAFLLLGACAAPPPSAPVTPVTAIAAPVPPPAPLAIPAPGMAAPAEVVEALGKACASSESAAERSRMLYYLASIPSRAGEACYLRALRAYVPGETEQDVRYAAQAVKALALEAAREPLFQAFAKLRASQPEAQRIYRDVHDAVLAVVDPAWEDRLLEMLAPAVDERDAAALNDQMFWQITAAECLGALRSRRAARPLLRVLLSPPKVAGHIDAIYALMRAGKPAAEAATELLTGRDAELVAYAETEARRAGATKATAAHVSAAALVLATIGRADSTGPLLDALATPDPVLRAVIARELTKLPAEPRIIAAFRATLEKMPVDVSIPNARGGAWEVLADKAAELHDPRVVPWLVDAARQLKGSEDDVAAAREFAFAAALRLAGPKQMKDVDALAKLGPRGQTVGDGFKKELPVVRALVAACGERVGCWLDKLVDPAAQTPAGQFQGIKAASMVAAFGDAATRAKIVAALPTMTNPAVRYAAALAIDRLSPRGDAATAAALQKIVDEDRASGDPVRISLGKPLKTVILRLQARAP
jgi:hypothetical protein